VKKLILLLVLFFIIFVLFSQSISSPGIICYNLTRDEMIEFNQNSEYYKKLIRDILIKNNASTFSLIIQGGNTFVVNIIGNNIEEDIVLFYDSDKKILNILYFEFDEFNEEIITNVEIIRNGHIIKLDKFDTPFIIRSIDNIFENLGIVYLDMGI